ncbi:MAG: hypothetical protein AAF587_39575 [Bacteroidota bacterium]
MRTLTFFTGLLLFMLILCSCQSELENIKPLSPADHSPSSARIGPKDDGDPGPTENQESWLAFYRGFNSNKVFFARSSNGQQFSEVGSLGLGEQTDRTPTCVQLGDRIFSYYRGNTSHKFFMAFSDDEGDSWTGNWNVINQQIGAGPAAVEYNGEIFVFFPNNGSTTARTIEYWRSSNGFMFTGPFFPEVQPTTNNPDGDVQLARNVEMAPVVHNGRLYLIYVDEGRDIRVISTMTGNQTEWIIGINDLLSESTKDGISATSTGSEIVVAFTGRNTNKVYTKRATAINSSGGLNWNTRTHVGAYSNERPGIATNQSVMSVLYKDGGSSGNGHVQGDFTNLPGNTWNPIPWSSSGPNYFGYTSSGVSLMHVEP